MTEHTFDSSKQELNVGSGDVEELGRRLGRIFSRGFRGVEERRLAGDRVAKILGLVAARVAQPVSA